MKKILKNALIITLLLMLGLSTAALAYLHFFTQEVMDVSGEWAGELDMTEQAGRYGGLYAESHGSGETEYETDRPG